MQRICCYYYCWSFQTTAAAAAAFQRTRLVSRRSPSSLDLSRPSRSSWLLRAFSAGPAADDSNSNSTPQQQQQQQQLTRSLLSSVLNRAERTLATTKTTTTARRREDGRYSADDDGGGGGSSSFILLQGANSTATDVGTFSLSSPPTATATTQSLLSNVLDRAESTLSARQEDLEGAAHSSSSSSSAAIRNLLQDISEKIGTSDGAATQQSAQTRAGKDQRPVPLESAATLATPRQQEQLEQEMNTNNNVAINYGQNPTITSTALAQSLWSHVLRPGADTAIDATAGNGSDSVALAKLLFASTATTATVTTTESHLLAVDVQEAACQKTRSRLAKLLAPENGFSDASVWRDHVQVLCTSHAPLPLPRDASSVALVVYNLGFLPNSDRRVNAVLTQTETTIASLADAALVLRVGGMLSIMTYPRTNRQEDAAVRALVEGLALFSSQTSSYTAHLQSLKQNDNNNDSLLDDDLLERLRLTLRHVLEEGGPEQTWRVHEHKKLGWVDAPILLTATRIK